MEQIPSQHCELGSSSALPGWLVIPVKPLGNPLKQLNELLGITGGPTVSHPPHPPTPNSRNTPELQAEQRVPSRSVPSPLLRSAFSFSLLRDFVI